MPIADLGQSFQDFYDAVESFFENLAAVQWGSLILALSLFTIYLTLRARASFNILRAAYPAERFRFLDVWGAYFAGYGFNSVIPARGGDVVRLFLTKTAVPELELPGRGRELRRGVRLRPRDGRPDPDLRVQPGRVPQAAGLRRPQRVRPLLPRVAPALHALPAHLPRRSRPWWASPSSRSG